MVDIGESLSALSKTPEENIKQRRSFVYHAFFDKSGQHKQIRVVKYRPNTYFGGGTITVIKNLRLKLRKNRIIESDFVLIPSRGGDIHIPVDELQYFSDRLRHVAQTLLETYDR